MDVKKKPKIIISVDPIKYPLTGIGRYTLQLKIELQRLLDKNIYFHKGYSLTNKFEYEYSNNSKFNYLFKSIVKKNHFIYETYRILNSKLKSYSLIGEDNSLFHGTNFYLPKFNGKKVVSFHDLSVYNHENYHSPENISFHQKNQNFAIRNADAFITDSEFIKNELSEYFSIPNSKIYSIPLASSKNFYPRSEEELKDFLSKYHLIFKNYTLFVGTIEHRKNINGLLKAYKMLPKKIRFKYPLVLVGSKGWQSQSILLEISKCQKEGWLHYMNYVTDYDLSNLMAGAKVFVYPSFYEGFGLPVLEAMSSGVPVICSNTSSLGENFESVALTFNPKDIEKLSLLILEVLINEDLYKILIKKSLKHSKNYSWEKCAKSTFEVYKKVLKS